MGKERTTASYKTLSEPKEFFRPYPQIIYMATGTPEKIHDFNLAINHQTAEKLRNGNEDVSLDTHVVTKKADIRFEPMSVLIELWNSPEENEDSIQNNAKEKADSAVRAANNFFKHTNNDVMVDVADTRPEEVKYSEMLDRSWLDTETYEEEMLDIDRHDPFMSLLCATNLDLRYDASTTSA